MVVLTANLKGISCGQPVTFRYKCDLDPAGIPQFGLVAEQVEKVNPNLVARDGEGKAYMVRYEAVNAMSLNEFLREHLRMNSRNARSRTWKRPLQSSKGISKRKFRLSAQASKTRQR